MVKIVISGICGKMGKRIEALASEDRALEVTGGLEAPNSPYIGKGIVSNLKEISAKCDVLIEFATADAVIEHLKGAVNKKIGMVIGTTAFSSGQIEEIKKASKEIPIVFSPNMSIGANILFKITEDVCRALGDDYDVSIKETHHIHKKDVPSGTAKKLGEAVQKVRGRMPLIESKREGEAIGDHTVIFSGKTETIELTHKAHSRDVFAKGALDAAKFLAGRKAGLYTMIDIIEKMTNDKAPAKGGK